MDDVLLGTIPVGGNRQTKVYACGKATAKVKLETKDEYFKNQTIFDRASRIGISSDLVDPAYLEVLYVNYVTNQIMEWSADEINSLKTIVKNMSYTYMMLDEFYLPEAIYMVKTTGYEEGAAAYTRQLDTIVLPQNMVSSLSTFNDHGDPLHPSGNTAYLQGIITHESFHVFSKNCFHNDLDRILDLYGQLGYKSTGNNLELPDVSWPDQNSLGCMKDMKITNPDSPMENTYIELEVDGERDVPLTPLLIANAKYDGGAFFEYLEWYMLRIERKGDQWNFVLKDDGYPMMYNMNETPELMREYLSKIGYNLTNEIFQADEVLAQSFVLIMEQNLPSAGLLDRIKSQL